MKYLITLLLFTSLLHAQDSLKIGLKNDLIAIRKEKQALEKDYQIIIKKYEKLSAWEEYINFKLKQDSTYTRKKK